MKIECGRECPEPKSLPTFTMEGSGSSALMALRLIWHWTWQLSMRGFLYGAFYGVWFFIIGAMFGCVIGLMAGAVCGVLEGLIFAILYVVLERRGNSVKTFLSVVTWTAPFLTFVTCCCLMVGMSTPNHNLFSDEAASALFVALIPCSLAAFAAWQTARKMADWDFE
jgi:hypothetical protein